MNRHKTGLIFLLLISGVTGILLLQAIQPQLRYSSAKEENYSHFELKTIVDFVKDKKVDVLPALPSTAPKGDALTVLLIGMDNRPREKYLGNTDTIMLARVDYEKKRVVILSIPRDTQVYLAGYGETKINAAARISGSLEGAVTAVGKLLGEKIDGYAAVNFNGFKDVIDTLGGVTLTVEKDMHYDTGDGEDGVIDLKKGTQHLNGAQALQYARFRYDPLGDITRVGRQQTLAKAVLAELRQPANLIKVPLLIPRIYAMTSTDIGIGQLWRLGKFMTANNMAIVSQTLPGDFATEKGISYWKVRPEECRRTVRNLFAGDF